MSDDSEKKEECKLISTVLFGAAGMILTGGNPAGAVIGAKAGEHFCNLMNPSTDNKSDAESSEKGY